jgi:DNA invertase Pin-like site-specific DNA recombinase
MIGVLAERERHLISARTPLGVQAAKRRSVKSGRKARLTQQQIGHARKLINQGDTPQSVAAILRVSRATLYRVML